MSADPLWGYPGGKRGLAPVIREILGDDWTSYMEPMVGAGSVALSWPGGPRVMRLTDLDAPLVAMWQAIQADPRAAHARACELTEGPWTRERYHLFRERERHYGPMALWVILQACYNSVYRRGRFDLVNTPWGKKPTVSVPPIERWIAVGEQLSRSTIYVSDVFGELKAAARSTIYLDCPYVGTAPYSRQHRWAVEDLRRLVSAAQDAAERGNRVALSHTADEALWSALAHCKPRRRREVHEVEARTSVNQDGAKRQARKEAVIVF